MTAQLEDQPPCRACGVSNEVYADAANLDAPRQPSEGQVVFCIGCGEISLWRAGHAAEPTISELEAILEHPEIARLNRLLHAAIGQRPR